MVDRRTQRTKNLLWEALVSLILKNGYESVTIQDIIDKANVGRSTFYSHYESKENLLLSGQVHIFGEMFEDDNSSETPNFKALLKHGKENINLTKAILERGNEQKIVEHMHNFISQKLEKFTKSQTKVTDKIENLKLELLINSASAAITNLILNWIKNDIIIILSEIEEMINNIIRSMLARYC